MSNKTFIPAFKAHVGDWNYYLCIMKYAEVARQVGFAYELGGNRDLNTMIQRGISNRTEGILKYLLQSEHRFLGSLIIATWGGAPEYIPLKMDDPDQMMQGLDREFGVLTLDGTHSFFALDGQHRLRAIKDAVKVTPALGAEDISVLLVPHLDDPGGRERTRRLFTNINRNAKTTTAAENIVLDVDDGYAVITRDLLNDHPFLKETGVVKVFSKAPGEEGEMALAQANISKTDPKAWTTITVLYDLLKSLGFGLNSAMADLSLRPSDDVLKDSYQILADRIDQLLDACGDVKGRLTFTPNARDLRAPKNAEAKGHAFMRPVIQRAVARVLRQIIDQQDLSWNEALQRLSGLDWEIGKAPWTAVFNPEAGSMSTGKENSQLLLDLLYVHLAPRSAKAIKDVRRTYRELKNAQYPYSEADLATRLKAATDTGDAAGKGSTDNGSGEGASSES
jgi:DNA sulfur modification protein DndB